MPHAIHTHHVDRNTAFNSEGTSTSVVATTKPARQIDEAPQGRSHHDPASSTRLPDYANLHRRLRKFVTTDKDHIIDLLTKLTNAIGSADSLIQLKTSISFARQKEYVANSSNYASYDLAHTMLALDMLETVSHHASILRRYYLVRLLRYRMKIEADHHKERDESKHHNKKLKSSVQRHESRIANTRNKERLDSQQFVQEKTTRAVRADSQALQDMMKTLYPHLRTSSKDAMKDRDKSYERLLSKLKNRLACARNWQQFADQYSIGILAVIPSGSRSGISSDQ